ncbi:unannotated protein [freshwater metagenome]|uniref:Unannotated protein n=1 Tax=freshwater metagenome TaxID=449393 RepID=A0A6J6Z276_9ZZZZ
MSLMMYEDFAPAKAESAAIGAELAAVMSAGASDARGAEKASGAIFAVAAISATD